jgi:energy-coupling factor transporter ATP-binding protein EcfA2
MGDDGAMLFLLSGSNSSGKSTLARALDGRVPDPAMHELGELAETPWQRGAVSWRRDLMEPWLDRVVAYEAEGRDVLLTEVVLGEVLAAPSATRVDGFAACLVDCDDGEVAPPTPAL